jgi:multicomponent Na+:H+ antiporter subunit F
MIVGWGRQDLSVLLVILALTAFISAVVVSRFAVRERSDARRILTAEEAERQRVEREQAARDADRAEREQAARDAAREADLTASGSGLPDTEEEAE